MAETSVQRPAAEPERRLGWARSALLVLLALISLGSVYAASTLDGREPAAPVPVPLAEHDPAVDYHGFYGDEAGPFGLTWRWLSNGAALEVKGTGLKWLAFRATSHLRPRALVMRTRDGTLLRVPIDLRTRMHVAGPLRLKGRTYVSLTPSIPADPAPGKDRRQLSIFLSGATLLSEPTAAMPAGGFALTELDSQKRPFNWMGTRGRVDVLALPRRATRRAWISFTASAADATPRTLTISAGGVRHEVQVPARGRRARVTAGPFPLVEGAARLTLESSPPGRVYFPDTRRLSVQVWDLRASRNAPAGGNPR